MVGANHLLHMQWQQPNNHPLCHSCGATVLLLLQHRLVSCSSSKLTIPRASVCGQVYRYSPNLSITRVTKAHLFSYKRITTTRWSATSHLKSVNACLWDTLHSPSSVSTMLGPEWFIKPHTKAYNTPSNGYSKCDNHYLSISIWSRAHHSSKSLFIQELRLPSVPPQEPLHPINTCSSYFIKNKKFTLFASPSLIFFRGQ